MNFDFIIVGGGAHGCAVAYELARSGAGSIAVIEQDSIAHEASGGLGKRGVRANGRDLRELPLMREAYEIWPALAAELGADTGYQRTGGAYLVEGDAQTGHRGLSAIDARVRTQKELGIPTERWDRDQVQESYPGVSTAVEAAIHTPLDGVSSQELTTHAYASAARSLGAEFFEKTSVSSLETDSKGVVRAVLTEAGARIGVKRSILLANNAGAPPLVAHAFGMELPVWTIYPQALLLRAEKPSNIPMLTAHDNKPLSVKVLDDDIIMLSGGWRGKLPPQARRGQTVEKNVQGNVQTLESVFPNLGKLEVLEADASRAETSTVDQIPVIGPVAKNAFVATGWSGHGWALVPAVAKSLSATMTAQRLDTGLEAFSPMRFGSAFTPIESGTHA